jgi:hypothetical protein
MIVPLTGGPPISSLPPRKPPWLGSNFHFLARSYICLLRITAPPRGVGAWGAIIYDRIDGRGARGCNAQTYTQPCTQPKSLRPSRCEHCRREHRRAFWGSGAAGEKITHFELPCPLYRLPAYHGIQGSNKPNDGVAHSLLQDRARSAAGGGVVHSILRLRYRRTRCHVVGVKPAGG